MGDGGWVVGREVDKPPYRRHLRVAVVTWCISIRYLPCQGGTMAAVAGHDLSTGALQRHHSLNHDFTEPVKCSPEKQIID